MTTSEEYVPEVYGITDPPTACEVVRAYHAWLEVRSNGYVIVERDWPRHEEPEEADGTSLDVLAGQFSQKFTAAAAANPTPKGGTHHGAPGESSGRGETAAGATQGQSASMSSADVPFNGRGVDVAANAAAHGDEHVQRDGGRDRTTLGCVNCGVETHYMLAVGGGSVVRCCGKYRCEVKLRDGVDVPEPSPGKPSHLRAIAPPFATPAESDAWRAGYRAGDAERAAMNKLPPEVMNLLTVVGETLNWTSAHAPYKADADKRFPWWRSLNAAQLAVLEVSRAAVVAPSMTWRSGKTVANTIYNEDTFVGSCITPGFAIMLVTDANRGRAVAQNGRFGDPVFDAMSAECMRLREVIRTGGAAYQAERKIMGVGASVKPRVIDHGYRVNEWEIADDGEAYCAIGPWRTTHEEAERDIPCPRRKPAPTPIPIEHRDEPDWMTPCERQAAASSQPSPPPLNIGVETWFAMARRDLADEIVKYLREETPPLSLHLATATLIENRWGSKSVPVTSDHAEKKR